MLQTISAVRHAFVATGVVGVSALGAIGVVGSGDQGLLRAEHFDAKEITVSPAGGAFPNGVRIREVVDIDFGLEERRGYQRIIPLDFGNPTDVTASSPDANSELDIAFVGGDSRVRIGNRNITFTGQHRYVLEYTLPEAQLDSGELYLDIIGTDETFETDRFVVEVVGFDLDDTTCDVGSLGSFGGCDLDDVGNESYRTVIDALGPGQGITIGGRIASPIDVFDAKDLPRAGDLPDRNPTGLRPIGLMQLVIGALLAGGIFALFRKQGDNEVFGGGGAADAAFGDVPVPGVGDPLADVPTHRVPDNRLAELATIEFAPPRGVEPWQGSVLLRERVDDDTVSAWFSEMIARGAIRAEGTGSDITLWPGETTARLSAVDRAHLSRLFAGSPAVELGTYSSSFTSTWSTIRSEQQRFIGDAGWWERPPGGGGGRSFSLRFVIQFVVIGAIFVSTTGMAAALGVLLGYGGGWFAAALLTVVVAGAFASVGYWKMLASRTATGSALTLRTESFRRFLDASEGRHVDWAWENGLIREYSAWAVALGAADAWSAAIESSNIEHPQRFTSPLLVHAYASSFRSTRVPPSSSGSGGSGGGGFSSGGGVGGGGGGGSSGSW